MTNTDTLELLASLNPVPQPDSLDIDDAAMRARIDDSPDTGDSFVPLRLHRAAAIGWSWRPAAIAFGVVMLLGAGLAALSLVRAEPSSPAQTTLSPTTAVTTVPDDTQVLPANPVGDAEATAELYVSTFNDRDFDAWTSLWAANPDDEWSSYGYLPYPYDSFMWLSSVWELSIVDCAAVSEIRAECSITQSNQLLATFGDESPVASTWAFSLNSTGDLGLLQSVEVVDQATFESESWTEFINWQIMRHPELSDLNVAGRRPLDQPVEDMISSWWDAVDEWAVESGRFVDESAAVSTDVPQESVDHLNAVAVNYVQAFNDRDFDAWESLWAADPQDDFMVGYDTMRFPRDAFTLLTERNTLSLGDCIAVSEVRTECPVAITDEFRTRFSDEPQINETWAFELNPVDASLLQSVKAIDLGEWSSEAWDEFLPWHAENYPELWILYSAGTQQYQEPIEDLIDRWWDIAHEWAVETGRIVDE